MEKLDLLVWDDVPLSIEVEGLRSVTVSTAADLEKPSILMGRGAELRALVELWLDSYDVWRDVVAQVPGDLYLVTSSEPQKKSDTPGLLTHLSFFPKPDRLTDPEFFHGWHEVHTPTTGALHPLRQGYVRDAVARCLTDSPPVRGIVSEYFVTEDYLDPSRLFGSKEALQASVEELPLYADFADVSSCPLYAQEA